LELERMGKKSSEKIIKNIAASKERPLERLIFALGIRHVGFETAKLLEQAFANMDELQSASVERLLTVPSVGPVIAESVHAYFQEPRNLRVLDKLKERGVDPQRVVVEATGPQPLAGKSYVITGTLSSMTREEAEAAIRALGGTATSSVSRKTASVISGAEPGSKVRKAEQLGVPVLDEVAFLKLVGKG
ncbi:MAG: NAD-dependent DNA ligase LigA, partial [Chloroflexi bacterium]|nr:NAD-dependent DNA ligase LigA [Chloroflexota bacterium]